MRLLLIEDEPILRESVAKKLRRSGYETDDCGDGETALELIEHVWDSSVDAFSNSIRVHISALRKKLRTALGYDPIRNRIGEGYELEENEP